VRTNPQGLLRRRSDILVDKDWSPPRFEIDERDDLISLATERLRLEFARFPWQMRAFAAQGSEVPFFSQRVNDRAYGSSYEVSPIGFEKGSDGRTNVHETVAVTPGEAFYGLGEKFTPFDKWGQEHVSWAIDVGNVSSFRSYKNVPFLMSTAGYGLFVHTTYPIVYRMGSQSSISYSIHIDDAQLDYFLIYGPSFRHILRRYTDLTGRAPVPPKWSFGFWLSRCGYRSQEEVEEVARGMRARGLPCDVISLDPWWMGEAPWSTYEWDREAFPEPERMMQTLREEGLRTCLWIHPYVPRTAEIYDEGVRRGYFVSQADGSVSPPVETFSGTDLAAIDFTNPEAKAWFLSKLESLLDMGAAVFKTDFGEQAPVNAVYHNGRSGLEMHNLYPLLYNKAVFELSERYFGRGLVWGRSGYAGSQRYPVQWGGDSYGTLDQMACQIRGLLSYGMSGVPFCSHDVGGFDYAPQAFDYESQEGFPIDPLVYVRWLQFGVFSSHVRAHGKQPCEPWTCGLEAEEIAQRYLRLRYRLLPYIYSEAVRSAETGLPMVRPMVLAYQSDPTTHGLDLQYMFGESFLVAPVVSPTNQSQVYLPEGEWVDYWTKDVVAGGRWVEVEASLETLPLWVRAGAIIPMGPEMAYVDEKPLDPLTLEIYRPSGTAEFVLHDEDIPEILLRTRRQGDRLDVAVEGAACRVEVIPFGLAVQSALRDGEPLALKTGPGGQFVSFEATGMDQVTFLLHEDGPYAARCTD
jgi:alpha-D-xyloside xylohydrolase